MVDQNHESSSDSSAVPQRAAPPRSGSRRGRWFALAVLSLLAAAIFAAWWTGLLPSSGKPPLNAELSVVIRPAGSQQTPLVEEPGALPVRNGAGMSLQVNFNEPRYAYLLWIDTQGQVVPLYPWNNERIEVTDADQPPPVRIATKLLICPTIGSTWEFGPHEGLETVLLLVRRTPMPADARLGSLLASLPSSRMRAREELAVFGLAPGSDAVVNLVSRNRGTGEEARAVDQPLLARLDRLRDQFELIRVVRFAHAGQ